MIKIIFTDVDNTLTSPTTHKVPESAKKAVKLARDNGFKVFACTGRNTLYKPEGAVLDGIEFDGYVALTGQICYLSDGTFIKSDAILQNDVLSIMDLAVKLNHPVVHMGKYDAYITSVNDRVLSCHKRLGITLPEIRPYDGRELFSLSLYITTEEEKLYHNVVKDSAFTRGDELICDVISKKGGKHDGIEAVLNYLGLTPDEVLALGDGENDISMLEYAGFSVAMNHSAEHVKAAAKDIALPSDEDGFFKTFVKYGLIK
jgi:Cof subfamily protein (haloacid dehalogenase superfamily)